MKLRYCNDCDKNKRATSFSNRTGYQCGLKSSFCKQCMVRRATEWANRNKAKVRAYHLMYMKKKYGNKN